MSRRTHLLWLMIIAVVGIILFSLAANKMEEMQGPRVAPLPQTQIEGLITVKVSDPEVLEKIGTTTLVVDPDLLQRIKEIDYDSNLESRTISLDQ